MSRKCSVCQHPDKEAINRSIIEGVSLRDIGRRFRLDKTALGRHKNVHLGDLIMRTKEAEDFLQGKNLINLIRKLHQRTSAILDKAERKGDTSIALKALAEQRHLIISMAKMGGVINDHGNVNITNVIEHPDWSKLRTNIILALEPFPEAREAVIRVMKDEAGN